MRKPRIALIALLLGATLLAGCKQDLLTDLSQSQANRVVATLQKHHIEAHKETGEKARYGVTVAEQDFAAAASVLDAYGLPGKDAVNISDMFPADSVVATPTAEHARLLSGIEQRLEQSIQAVDEVVSARVHVSYDAGGNDGGAATPLRVSALVVYEQKLEESLFLEKIKRLLKNSFSDVRYEDISVVLFKRDAPQPWGPMQAEDHTGWFAAGLAALAALLALGTGFVLRDRIPGLARFRRRDDTAPTPGAGETAGAAQNAAAGTQGAAPTPATAAPRRAVDEPLDDVGDDDEDADDGHGSR